MLKKFNEEKQIEIENISKDIEEYMAVELAGSVDSLSTLIPKLKLLISPILRVGYNLQKNKGNVNMKKTLSSESGLWSSHVSINATT